MDTTFTPLSQLDPPALVRLAALHSSVMPTLLSELGDGMVLRYYQVAQTDASVLGLCSLAASGEVEAWAVGSPDPSALNARLRHPLGWFAGQILRLAFTRPGVLIDLLRSLLSASDANLLAPGQIELTYIAVSPQARGRGLGKAALAAFCQAALQAGYTSVALSVETDNPAALGLYNTSGFKPTRIFREGRFERQRMQCDLPTTS
ncbi:MAG TPA: GNAT family N-acetyltransferase [Anaerolineales bacterium]|jgi:ribosomal protein S18 acetylase RimI-like enzyme